MSTPVITVENLSKSYLLKHQQTEGSYTALRDVITDRARSLFTSKKTNNPATEIFWALKDVSFEVNQGDRIGIIGRNGAGKSTLLKILSRIVAPTKGQITIEGRVASLLEVGTGFHPELTGRENIFLNGAILGMNKAEIKSKFDEIVDFSGVEKFLDTPVKRFSSGMYVRLAFAVAAHLEPDILIIDEVLAVGDAEFQKKCLGKMQDVSEDEGRTILLVSHNMAAIKQLCNNAILLDTGSIIKIGNVNEVISDYQQPGRAQSTALSDNIKRKGTGLCRLVSIKLLNDFDEEKSIFKLGDKIKFSLTLKNLSGKMLEQLRIIIGVYNSYSEGYLRFDTNNSNTVFQFNEGLMEIICSVNEHLNIKPDLYSINIAILQHAALIDYIPGAKSFSVDNFDYFGTGRDIENSELSKVYYKHSWNSK